MGHQKKVPFRKWVPQWLQTVVALFILIPVSVVNGAYTGSSIDISGYLGVVGEDINMAFYASAAGMAIGFPMAKKLRAIITTKTILLSGLIIQGLLSWVCALTEHMEVIVFCSYFMGLLKAYTLLEIIVIIMPVFSPTEKRSEFYPYYYPISLTCAQIALIATSYCAFYYQWQYMYYLMEMLLLVSIILVLIFFHYGRRPIRIPLREIDWLSVAYVSAASMLCIYVFTYGKLEDWFNSSKIIIGTVGCLFFLLLFTIRQKRTKGDSYILIDIVQNRCTRIGYYMMFIMIFFSSSSAIVSSYTSSILRLDNVYANNLCWFLLPAFFIGGVFTWWWYQRRMPTRPLLFIGFTCNLLYLLLFYFQIHPGGTYQALFLPTFLRGLGLVILFVSTAVYAVEGLSATHFNTNAFFIIGIRSAIAPAISGGIFAQWIYHLTVKNNFKLSAGIDMVNPLAASSYDNTLHQSLAQGFSIEQARQLATNSLSGIVQQQSLLLSLKSIAGILIIVTIIILIATLVFPFYRKNEKTKIASGGPMV